MRARSDGCASHLHEASPAAARARAPGGSRDSRSIRLRLQILSVSLTKRGSIGGRAPRSIDRYRQRS
jgi:hypothetical protein